MFTQNFNIKRFTSIAIVGTLALLLSSCGTYNNGYNETDGIYATGNDSQTEEGDANDTNEKANYYKQYFKTKAEAYSDFPEENAIFTDIDAYSTTERLDEEGNIIVEENYSEEGYGPWGSNAEDVTINIFNYGGHGYGFYNSPFYGGYYGSWGHSYYGYYNPYWGIGYGWGYPYYGFGYGFGYGYPYYGSGYYNPYHYNNSYYNGTAYNRGRRNTDYNRTQARGRTNDATTRTSSYSRSESTRRVNSNNVRANTNIRSSNTIRNNNTIRTDRSNPAPVIRNTRSNPTRNSGFSQPTRSNSNNTRNSNFSTPTRSSGNSGSIRSSGGGSRSSGGATRSGGSGRGGRG